MPHHPSNHNPAGDLDNLAKGPMDAITDWGMLWADDVQVCLLIVVKRFVDSTEEDGVCYSYHQLPEES